MGGASSLPRARSSAPSDADPSLAAAEIVRSIVKASDPISVLDRLLKKLRWDPLLAAEVSKAVFDWPEMMGPEAKASMPLHRILDYAKKSKKLSSKMSTVNFINLLLQDFSDATCAILVEAGIHDVLADSLALRSEELGLHPATIDTWGEPPPVGPDEVWDALWHLTSHFAPKYVFSERFVTTGGPEVLAQFLLYTKRPKRVIVTLYELFEGNKVRLAAQQGHVAVLHAAVQGSDPHARHAAAGLLYGFLVDTNDFFEHNLRELNAADVIHCIAAALTLAVSMCKEDHEDVPLSHLVLRSAGPAAPAPPHSQERFDMEDLLEAYPTKSHVQLDPLAWVKNMVLASQRTIALFEEGELIPHELVVAVVCLLESLQGEAGDRLGLKDCVMSLIQTMTETPAVCEAMVSQGLVQATLRALPAGLESTKLSALRALRHMIKFCPNVKFDVMLDAIFLDLLPQLCSCPLPVAVRALWVVEAMMPAQIDGSEVPYLVVPIVTSVVLPALCRTLVLTLQQFYSSTLEFTSLRNTALRLTVPLLCRMAAAGYGEVISRCLAGYEAMSAVLLRPVTMEEEEESRATEVQEAWVAWMEADKPRPSQGHWLDAVEDGAESFTQFSKTGLYAGPDPQIYMSRVAVGAGDPGTPGHHVLYSAASPIAVPGDHSLVRPYMGGTINGVPSVRQTPSSGGGPLGPSSPRPTEASHVSRHVSSHMTPGFSPQASQQITDSNFSRPASVMFPKTDSQLVTVYSDYIEESPRLNADGVPITQLPREVAASRIQATDPAERRSLSVDSVALVSPQGSQDRRNSMLSRSHLDFNLHSPDPDAARHLPFDVPFDPMDDPDAEAGAAGPRSPQTPEQLQEWTGHLVQDEHWKRAFITETAAIGLHTIYSQLQAAIRAIEHVPDFSPRGGAFTPGPASPEDSPKGTRVGSAAGRTPSDSQAPASHPPQAQGPQAPSEAPVPDSAPQPPPAPESAPTAPPPPAPLNPEAELPAPPDTGTALWVEDVVAEAPAGGHRHSREWRWLREAEQSESAEEAMHKSPSFATRVPGGQSSSFARRAAKRIDAEALSSLETRSREAMEEAEVSAFAAIQGIAHASLAIQRDRSRAPPGNGRPKRRAVPHAATAAAHSPEAAAPPPQDPYLRQLVATGVPFYQHLCRAVGEAPHGTAALVPSGFLMKGPLCLHQRDLPSVLKAFKEAGAAVQQGPLQVLLPTIQVYIASLCAALGMHREALGTAYQAARSLRRLPAIRASQLDAVLQAASDAGDGSVQTPVPGVSSEALKSLLEAADIVHKLRSHEVDVLNSLGAQVALVQYAIALQHEGCGMRTPLYHGAVLTAEQYIGKRHALTKFLRVACATTSAAARQPPGAHPRGSAAARPSVVPTDDTEPPNVPSSRAVRGPRVTPAKYQAMLSGGMRK